MDLWWQQEQKHGTPASMSEKKEHEKSHEGIKCNYEFSAHQLAISCTLHLTVLWGRSGSHQREESWLQPTLSSIFTFVSHWTNVVQNKGSIVVPSALPHTAVNWLQSSGRIGSESTMPTSIKPLLKWGRFIWLSGFHHTKGNSEAPLSHTILSELLIPRGRCNVQVPAERYKKN